MLLHGGYKCASGRSLFAQYAGFREVRLVAAKRVAFVEFDVQVTADMALRGLNNFKLTAADVLKLTYAKKFPLNLWSFAWECCQIALSPLGLRFGNGLFCYGGHPFHFD